MAIHSARDPGTIPPESVAGLLDEITEPTRFFVRPDFLLVWQPPAVEENPWEIFRGRLLDPAHTRQKKSFVSWNIYQVEGGSRSAEPLLSVKLDEGKAQIHIVRAILSHVWEGFDAGNSVIQSRETTKWVRELVGTIPPGAFSDAEELQNELTILLQAAVQGTSRLPVNSVEAPLPAYTLGQLAYVGAAGKAPQGNQPLRSWPEMLQVAPLPLESLLRALTPDQATLAARQCIGKLPDQDFLRLLRQVFNNVSLSPYTQFVDTAMAFVKALVDLGKISAADEIDFWSWLLRQLGRHLTAYDLITFHFRGANYPDALLLDAVLKRYLDLIEARPELFQAAGNDDEMTARRLRRRALRQGCLLRRYYEGHAVPDAPTSPGENARVLPTPHVRVPDEQLLNVLRRRKRLYAGEPLASLLTTGARTVLGRSIADLAHAREWRELGSAVFVDRPFGWGKAVGEPDVTPLLAHEAFSPSIARRRFQDLERLAHELNFENAADEVPRQNANLQVMGLLAAQVAEPDRPVVSLADARRVADDFVIVRTLRQGVQEVLQALDFTSLRARTPFPDAQEKVLLIRLQTKGKDPVLAWFDGKLRKRLEMDSDLAEGFCSRRGTEMPAAGMRVVRIWDETGQMRQADVRIPSLTCK